MILKSSENDCSPGVKEMCCPDQPVGDIVSCIVKTLDKHADKLTTSSIMSLIAVSMSTQTSGMIVVIGVREEMAGINCQQHIINHRLIN